jgi:alanyl-tRNA synthetase
MVRVVSIGVPVADLLKDPANAKWRQYSVEFCGGTHLKNTGEAGGFTIMSEESVSKGVRRIVAVTGELDHAANFAGGRLEEEFRLLAAGQGDLSETIKVLNARLAEPNLPLTTRRAGQATLVELQARQKAWEKSQRASSGTSIDVATVSTKLLADAEALGGGKLIVGEVPGATDEQLRGAMDSLRKKSPSHGILLGSASDGKVSFVAAVSDDLIARGLKAGDWIRETAKVAGGGGGGKPQMAQAGGKDPSKLADALAKAREYANGVVK